MKAKSHIHVANIVLNEINKNNGRIRIKSRSGKVDSEYHLPENVYKALTKYPSYFRAGAVGPDFFPDPLFGQMAIHPQYSGLWIERMYEVLRTYNPSNEQYFQALAFYLGYCSHYSTDLFGHEDVNKYAGGYFPSYGCLFTAMFNGDESYGNDPDVQRIMIHIATEGYMDSKLKNSDESFEIKAPIDYIRRCFATGEALQFMKDHHIPYNEEEFSSFNPLAGFVEKYEEAALRGALYRTGYIRTIEKREEYIIEWLTEWERFAQNEINGGISLAVNEGLSNLFKLVLNFLGEYANADGISDFYMAVTGLLGQVGRTILAVATAGMSESAVSVNKTISFINESLLLTVPLLIWIKIVDANRDKKAVITYKDAIGVLVKYYSSPDKILNDSKFSELITTRVRQIYKEDAKFKQWFEDKTLKRDILGQTVTFPRLSLLVIKPKPTDYFDYKWGNYGKTMDPFNQDYIQIERCINMTKLCLIGANNLNNLVYQADKTMKEERYLFKGSSYRFGYYRLKVNIEMRDEWKAGTNADILLKVVTKDNRESRYLLDTSGKNDFERGDKATYQIYTTHFFEYSNIKSMSILRGKRGAGVGKFGTVTVTDVDNGLIVAKATGNYDLYKEGDEIKLTLSANSNPESMQNIEESKPFVSRAINGFYLYHEETDSIDNVITLRVTSKAGVVYEESAKLVSYRKRQYGGLYFPIIINRSDIYSISIKAQEAKTYDHIYLYDGTNFYFMGSLFKTQLSSKEVNIPLKVSYDEHYHMNGKQDWTTYKMGVIVKTASTYISGTNDDFFLDVKFKGEDAYEPFKLDQKFINNFEKGDIDVFYLDLEHSKNIRNLEKLTFRKKKISDVGDWTFEFIAFIDIDHGQTIAYVHNGTNTTMIGSKSISITNGYWTTK